MKKKVLFGIALILGLFILTGCDSNITSDDEIISFSYNYGSYNDGYYNYIIEKEDNNVTIKAKGSNGVHLDFDKKINKSVLDKLNKIIIDNNIDAWDGFDEKNDKIIDGYSFSLNVEYASGKTIRASGYHIEPKNYDKGHEALTKYLKTIK